MEEDKTQALLAELAKRGITPEALQKHQNSLFTTAPEPLFYSTKPTHIQYRKLGEAPKLIPLEEFEKMDGIIWTNSPVTGRLIRDTLFNNNKIPRGFSLSVAEALAHDPHDFTVSEINEIVGKGVIYTPQKANEVLKQGDTLGLYTGLLESANTGKTFSPYGYRVDDQTLNDQSVFHANGFGKAYYDAQLFRNLTSYIQHAPSVETLATLNIPDELRQYIVTPNVGFGATLHLGVSVLQGMALRDIKAEEQLLFDYGTYFEGKSYQLFDKENQVIGTINAQKQFELNPDYKPGGKPAPRCKPTDSKEASRKSNEKEILLSDKSSRHFIENLKVCITIYQKRNIPGTELLFKNLLDCLSDKYSPSEIHDKVHHIAIDTDQFKPFPKLDFLKQELMIYFRLHAVFLSMADDNKKALDKKTKKPWQFMELDKKLCLCLFARKADLKKTKQELFNDVATTIKSLDGKDALIVCFSQLLLQHEKNKEKATQAQEKKPTAQKKKK